VKGVREGVGAAPAPFPARAVALVAAFFAGGAAFFATGAAFFGAGAVFLAGAAFFGAAEAFFGAGVFFVAGAADFLAVEDAFFTGPDAAFLAVDVVFLVAVAAFFTGAAFFFVRAGRFPALAATRAAFDLFPGRLAAVERDVDPRLAGEPLLAGVILPSFGPPDVAAYRCSLALGSG
jgi:hypothetical protein